MTFYGIYDGHKMSHDSIKVWQYRYQIIRIDQNVADQYKIFNFHSQGNEKTAIFIFKILPFVVPFIKWEYFGGPLKLIESKNH